MDARSLSAEEVSSRLTKIGKNKCNPLIQSLTKASISWYPFIPSSGNTVRVHAKVVEGNRKKNVLQTPLLCCYCVKVLRSLRKLHTVRKNSNGVGVERIFQSTPTCWNRSSCSLRKACLKLYLRALKVRQLVSKELSLMNKTLLQGRFFSAP